jgi:enoyl-[acyl-carrier protein] reductase II
VEEAEMRGAGVDELKLLLGKGRAKKGMFEGDLENGELEIGQISSVINDIVPVSEIMKSLMEEYRLAAGEINSAENFRF